MTGPSLTQRTVSAVHRVSSSVPAVVWPLLTAGAGIAAMTMVHFLDPNEQGNYPTCPWLMLTGTYCPGCGTMRAVAALSHLDLMGAVQMNVLLLGLLPFLLWAWTKWFYRCVRPPTGPPPAPTATGVWILLIVIVGFWVIRNLPFATFLAPGGATPPVFG